MLAQARATRGLRLRLRYEYLSAEVTDDPEPWEPDADDLAAIEEELRAAVERMRTIDEWHGVADAEVCGTAVPLDLPRQRGTRRSRAGRCSRPTAPSGSDRDNVRRMIDPRTPVVVGVGQVAQRVAAERRARSRSTCSPTRPASPTPTRRRARRCSTAVDVVAIVADRLVAVPRSRRAARAQARHRRHARPLVLDGRRQQPAAARERAGASAFSATSSTSCSIGGAESMHTRWRARREPRVRAHMDDRRRRAVRVGHRRRPARAPATYEMPRTRRSRRTQVYPLFETALRAAAGRIDRRAPAARRRAVGALRRGRGRRTRTRGRARAYTAEEIRTVSPDNRMVCFPYPKRMCANIDVDQAAALLLCSYEAAQRRRRPRRPDRVPARGRRRARPLLLHRAGALAESPGDRDRGRRRARRRRHQASTTSRTSTSTRASRPRCRWRCASLGLADDDPARSPSPAGSASRAVRSTTTRRTRSRAMVEVLRADPGPVRLHDRARLVHHEARGRRVVGDAARARVPPRRPGRRAGRGRRAPGREPAGCVDEHGDDRGDVGRVRTRRHAVARHRDRADRRRPPRASRTPATPMLLHALTTRSPGRPRASGSPTTARRTTRDR